MKIEYEQFYYLGPLLSWLSKAQTKKQEWIPKLTNWVIYNYAVSLADRW